MDNDKAIVKERVKTVEKEIHKTNNLLNELTVLEGSLGNIYKDLLSIEELTEENPLASSVFRELLKEQKLIGLYKKLDLNLSKLKQLMQKYEEPSVRSNLFLENYRNYRSYVFPSRETAANFAEQMFSLFSVTEAVFKPEFIGTIDLDKVSQELKVQRKDAVSLIIPVAKIQELVRLLDSFGVYKSFKLETELEKLIWKENKTLFVESDNAKIKRLDRLCKSLDGNYVDE